MKEEAPLWTAGERGFLTEGQQRQGVGASATSSDGGKNVGLLGKGGGARRVQSVGKRGPR